MSKMIKLRKLFPAEYIALKNAIYRFHNADHPAYSDYGARGIQVCEEWRSPIGFYLFFDHIGARPGSDYSLDRIDNSKGYEPGNVRWADHKTQQGNRRKPSRKVCDFGWGIGFAQPHGLRSGRRYSALVPLNGRTQTISDWSRELGLKSGTIRRRLACGLPPEQALSTTLAPSGPSRKGPKPN